MAVYGYHRTSTKEQHLDRGIAEIRRYCEEHDLQLVDIYTDQQTGKNFNRPEYQFIRKRLLRGDVLILSELDRLGRNKEDTLKELRFFKDTGVRVMILEIPTTLVDYTKMDSNLSSLIMEAINNMLVEMYAVFAEAEIRKKEKRQREGIAQMKARGEWDQYGRPAAVDWERFCAAFQEVLNGQITGAECQRQLGISASTYYRYRNKYIMVDNA